MTPQRRRFADGRWHFQHGPIDCILGADGDTAAIGAAVEASWQRFREVLDELVGELPLLRRDLSTGAPPEPRGPIARRMVAACAPHAANGGCFITAMAAVAGSVAQELLAPFERDGIERAYVNNGGDIALRLVAGQCFHIGWVTDPLHATLDGAWHVDAASPVRGVATSGWRGRSFSLGIADSVTVLATSAADADAAATVIANAVDLAGDRRVRRAPAASLRDDSDLGERLVTTQVSTLDAGSIDRALASGATRAAREIAAGRVHAAALCLQGRVRLCGDNRFVGAHRSGRRLGDDRGSAVGHALAAHASALTASSAAPPFTPSH